MDIWTILGIYKTSDIKIIKQAYAAKSKSIHPEEQPKEFQRLHDAYRAAISYAKMMQIDSNVSFVNNENLVMTSNDYEEESHDKELKDLFNKFDLEEIQKNRIHACEYLQEIFESVHWSDPEIWQEYVDSDIFQKAKYDEEFLDYLCYVLQVMQLKTKYAKVLYRALEYDKMESSEISNRQVELYSLLKKYTLDPYRFKKIIILSDVVCIVLALFLLNYLPIIVPVCAFLHCAIYYFVLYSTKNHYKKYGFINKEDFNEYLIGAGPIYCFISIALAFIWGASIGKSMIFRLPFVLSFIFLIGHGISVGIKDFKK